MPYQRIASGPLLDFHVVRSSLNLCAMARRMRGAWADDPVRRHRWQAALKARQLGLACYRVAREYRQARERGWLERDPETGRDLLAEELMARLHALQKRKLRAIAVVAKLDGRTKLEREQAERAFAARRAASPPSTPATS